MFGKVVKRADWYEAIERLGSPFAPPEATHSVRLA
jgi:hypothetical protein